MHVRIPLLFTRFYSCTDDNGLTPNAPGRKTDHGYPLRISFVVMLPKYNDGRIYDSRWMCDGDLITDDKLGHMILVDDVDIVEQEDVYIFDEDDHELAHKQALRKMKELWAEMELES